jgi:putative peptide zinc metalloprotease protein
MKRLFKDVPGWLANLELVEVDTSSSEPMYAAKCQNGMYLRLSADIWLILNKRKQGWSPQEIAKALTNLKRVEITTEEVCNAFDRISNEIDSKSQISIGQQLDLQGYWLKFTLIPASLVRAVAQPLSRAFDPLTFVTIVCFALVSTALIGFHTALPMISTLDIAFTMVLLFLSIVAHELGHASACAKFSVKPGDIGFTMYLIYPALYTDVNAAWRLKRFQRVIIDLGGVYFQLLGATICLLAYRLVAWPPLIHVVPVIILNCFLMLNPFLKFDGYWLLSDALGVPNLSQQSLILWRDWLAKVMDKHRSTPRWPRSITLVTMVYGVLRLAFYFVLIGAIVYFYVVQAPVQLAAVASLIGRLLAGESVAGSVLFAHLLTLLPTLLVLVSVSRILVRKGKPLSDIEEAPCRI